MTGRGRLNVLQCVGQFSHQIVLLTVPIVSQLCNTLSKFSNRYATIQRVELIHSFYLTRT